MKLARPEPKLAGSRACTVTICSSGNTGKGPVPAAPSILLLKMDLKAEIVNKFISRKNWMEVTNNVLDILVVTRIEYKELIFHTLILK